MSTPTLILASASPRRRDLLRQIGLEPQVVPSHIDETLVAGADPMSLARTLATHKAEHVATTHRDAGAVVIGADTVIELADEVVGKPRDRADAATILRRLSGRTHLVHTGLHLVDTATGRSLTTLATTAVTMRVMTEREILAYVGTGDGLDAAGAYAIQGRAAVFVERIDGDYSTVVGLPLPLVTSSLAELGWDLTGSWAAP